MEFHGCRTAIISICNHFSQPPSYSLANVVFCCCQSSLLTHVQLIAHQRWTELPPACALAEGYLIIMQDLASAFAGSPEIPTSIWGYHFCSLQSSLWMAALPASRFHTSHHPGVRWLRMHCATLPVLGEKGQTQKTGKEECKSLNWPWSWE